MFIFWIVSLPKWISETQQFDSKLQITGCNVLLLKSGFANFIRWTWMWLEKLKLFWCPSPGDFWEQDPSQIYVFEKSTWRIYLSGTETGWNLLKLKTDVQTFLWHISSFDHTSCGAIRQQANSGVLVLLHATLKPTTNNSRTQEKDLQISIACLGWGIVTTYLRLQRCHLGRSSHSKDPCTSVHS